MNYDFNEIEAKWQKYWAENQTFKAANNSDKEKFYVLDMFPYPSGAGLHVGHPLGYIASDIYARYKRHKGFNVLHPMGYDSFGLPAEQYAIQTGQHPADTTRVNIDGGFDKEGNEIKGYRKQLDVMGFSFDWSREVRTSNPDYYKWTQWIFIQLFNSWYNNDSNKAEDISTLIALFEKEGNTTVNAVSDEDIEAFTAEQWKGFDTKKKQEILLQYRLTYLADTEVNWCPALGTVLANDEIVNGVSERGGHPVIRKKMTQWSMRISAYAQRLLDDLTTVDWPQPLKDSQTNWIGRSQGASAIFNVKDHDDKIEVFTTRPDTIFGVSFMTLAPEHDLVSKITTPEQKEAVEAYIEATAKRSERERMADVKTISGVFTGAYAEHPFTKEPIPIWIGDYVLAGYGTGAVMAVPCGDQRDYDFAKHFNITIPNIFEGVDISEEAFADKGKTVITNSDFLNGLPYKKAMKLAIYELEKIGHGKGKINYRLRDAVFSRQRYWGEPFPVYYVDGMPQMIDAEHLPIALPEVEKYLPTETGEPPLGNATIWAWNTETNEVVDNSEINNTTVFPLELNTMPGWAGSSFYFNRYMDPNNENEIFSKEAINYWQDVDLYIGGSEHATGHLLYARFWQKFLFDKGVVPKNEFAKKLINQGMITGTSALVYRINLKVVEKSKIILREKGEAIIPKEAFKYISVKSNIFASYKLLDSISSKTVTSSNSVITAENIELAIKLMSIFKVEKNIIDLINDGSHILDISYDCIRIDVNNVDASDKIIDFGKLRDWNDFQHGNFIDDIGVIIKNVGEFTTGREVEKMSKRWYNVVSPDSICVEYGADSLRLYEMFLGPLEQSKPWNTAGITGAHGFLKKLWRLYVDDNGVKVTDTEASKDSLKTLHKTIKKVEEDIENFSFNTSVSTFMIAVNELSSQKCTSREVLEALIILVSPYAPHIAEELWNKLGHSESISTAPFPKFESSHLVESSKEYPVSFNGKMRFKLELPLDLSKEEIEKTVMEHEKTQKQLAGRTPKKVIIVPGKIINIVG
ncbi:leucine--tRNA ligase [Cellulophaga baltica]|uniref:leucine--tRNA ligase n=1 Tax=Cellulophaga TaxID=104264 RepID=UPI001C065971|nr:MULTISPECIES: class I tRNA ligase family protein [Cellulophaga]MBU2995561.1 leucine--tRNA ligase [Cellulophaga baltica]MDO6766955.1 class I tRNA ligase family protein [Cellulophaga sp. 1_MG-2023]